MKLLQIIESQVTDTFKWRRLNGWLVIFWAVMFAVSIVFHWLSIVAFVSLLSIYANFATHLGVWAASRAEAKQVEIDENHHEVSVGEAEEVNVGRS